MQIEELIDKLIEIQKNNKEIQVAIVDIVENYKHADDEGSKEGIFKNIDVELINVDEETGEIDEGFFPWVAITFDKKAQLHRG
ncbi:MAG: hypothetical protein A2W90_02450 [Bacteroidetes bacterium GWF2_42_66]|nr:MAG: hypothetical protein A2W92_08525 [Bacteroidetes bacterium GWA2_42_15]OFY01211.1 MAG: hypothetical protein A2W89_15935 [Bacteroidetes bacterium GWE2_42_39]OFY42054.1 MAG: hypothetical protein A2W90_02450 [Bacteroidetes bacterium GWF2_42_66]HBL77743.1 hypothetical protein [Prolixibacteraceae bacterium]HCB62872.1 hypothetical protein [Bacteroidales bacterium]